MNCLKVDISKRIGSFSLKSQFTVRKGAVLSLFGPSGSGKSMTLKCIAGLEKADEGEVLLDDRVLFSSSQHVDIKPQKRKIGYLFQSYALFPDMNVYDNIKCALLPLVKNKTIKRADIDEMIKDNLNKYSLSGLEKHYPHELSGGQKQRVALSRILLSSPDCLLLDEPFSSIDDFLKEELIEKLLEFIHSFHGFVILVSHSIAEVAALCKEVCFIRNGHTRECEDVLAFKDRFLRNKKLFFQGL